MNVHACVCVQVYKNIMCLHVDNTSVFSSVQRKELRQEEQHNGIEQGARA